MNEKIVDSKLIVRAQALVLVSMMIVAGSIAMAPAVLGAGNSGNSTFDLTEPHGIIGYLYDDTGPVVPGVTVTVTNPANGEFVTDVTDASGRYSTDLQWLPSGYLAGGTIYVTTPEPDQGFASLAVDTAVPYQWANLTVDRTDPVIGLTTVAPLFINNDPLNTFGGIQPPVMITVADVTDDTTLAAAAWAVRDDLQTPSPTMYFSCDITNEAMPATYGWDGSWYHIGGVLVTAGISPFNAPAGDLFVFGEVNGTSSAGDEIGNVVPSHYVTFQPDGTYQAVYSTMGTPDMGDDLPHVPSVSDTFRAYRYDEGAGYVATASVSTFTVDPWVTLTISPIPDGRYAVCVSAIDVARNAAWINETTTPNMVITVDNFAPTATATGPATSDVYAFDVAYTFVADPLPSSGFLNVTLFYNREGAGWMTYGNDFTPDGTFTVDVSGLGGDGMYEWYLVAYDNTLNHDIITGLNESYTLVDTAAPTIGATSVDKLFINNDPLNTFGGIVPPAMVTTTVTDTNLAAAGWGIRDDLQIPSPTMYFTCDITNEVMPATYGWDGSWYHIGGVLVTAGISPFYAPAGDIFVFGEMNGINPPGYEIGNNIPSHYATFAPDGTYQGVYSTEGTLDYSDDVWIQFPAVSDTFTAYRYDEGAGYVVTASVSTFTVDPWVTLTISPIPEGRYAVCVTAIDWAQNSAWINETTTPNMVITVDNLAPDADATGPATSNVYIFDVTYSWIADPLPSSGLLNVSLWYNNGGGWIWFAEDPTPGDGFFPVDLTALGDGTYDWFMAGFDMTLNHEDLTFVAEATTIVDTTNPFVVTTTPLDAAIDVALTAGSYVIQFSEPMDTPAGAVTSDLPGVTWTWSANGIWLNGTYAALTESTTYNIDLSAGGFQDLLANPLVADIYGWTFTFTTIGIGPEVVTTTPLDAAIDVALAAGTYIIDFNEPMNAVGAATTDLPGASQSWFDADTLNIDYTLLTESTTYNIDLNGGGFQDVYGNALVAGAYGWTFTFVTVGVPPTIVTTVPADGDGGVALNQDIVITFSETINIATITYTCSPNPGGWSESWSAGDTVLTLSHTDFAQFAPYTFTVTYAEDIYGNALVAGAVPNPWSFETMGTFNLNYNAGWNLFSIPVLNPTVGGVPLAAANDIALSGALMVSKWDFATQRYVNYIPGFHTPADPQNFAILPDEAYWAWMTAAGSIAIDGQNPGARNVAVNGPGWNMIGYMSLSIGDVDTDWAPQVSYGAFDDIAYYDAGTFTHYIFAGTVMDLVPGRGYFVWNDIPTNIVYSSTTPGPIHNANTGDSYWTIQAAIDGATPSDTINVEEGTYYENLVIGKSLTIQGAGSGFTFFGGNPTIMKATNPTTINGDGTGSVITITAGSVTLMGMEITNSGAAGEDAGIKLINANNVVVDGTYIHACGYGIIMPSSSTGSDNCQFLNNHIEDIRVIGIYTWVADGNEIAGNYLQNVDACGIQLANSGATSANWIHDNDISDCALVAGSVNAGIFLWGSMSKNNVIEYNTLTHNYNGIGFRAAGITNNLVRYNTVRDSVVYGIQYTNGAGPNTFYQNNFIDNAVQTSGTLSTDVWNTALPDGGNYWSTYTTPDANGDGVVDNPLVIAGAQDNFPWTTENGWESPFLATVVSETTLVGDLDLMTATFPATVPAYFDTAGYKINSEIVLAGDVDGDITITRNGVPMVIVGGLTAGTYTYTQLVAMAYPIPEPDASDFNNAIYGGAVEIYTISVSGNINPINTVVTIRSIISNDGFATRTVLAELTNLPLVVP